ncbi:MAG: cysteine desulfurase [Candidatus Lindowbacteria bacterium RIFCSPLOWO2_12_FULL_62_27]|nr:MAG: cysteine desulfurase [Candidatus Lindowbacteria bacterium RIFCSPLOWO2_02_FULL_62_12]OGH62446.1 MAG: cysteine desulfurase [Candidatus Lindowbacteria bacterium RIFCSPLOWO2_12_FULL_62_27]
MRFDAAGLRKEFPILSREFDGKRLVYLDNPATTQKPRAVIDAVSRFYEHSNANVHRGAYRLAEESTAAYEGAREKVRGFLNAASVEEIIFTRGATESINLVAYAWGRKHVAEGDEIVLTEMEHHSNLVPWQLLAQEKKAVLRFVPVENDGTIDVTRAAALITPRTRLVSMTQVSNVLGTINPVRRIAELARERGALLLVDGAQSVPHMAVDVRDIGCDFFVLSGHKMLAPTGIGALYVRKAVLETMPPFHGGGDMIRQVFLDHATWNDLPWKFEAGTPNFADAVGLAAAIDFLSAVGLDALQEHERALTGYAIGRLGEMAGVTLYGPRDVALRGGVVSFNVEGVHPHDLATILDRESAVAIRAGHHCAQPLMKRLNVAATARAGFYLYNVEEDIDRLVEGIHKAEEIFKT